jgi:histidinol-phosphatase
MAATVDYSEELQSAIELARRGGRIALGHFRHDPQTKQKADGTWVTEADWAVEAQIRLWIARSFSDHNVLGEEEGITAAGGGPPIERAPTWIIDPIDGTNNYIAGIPIWAVLIALQIDGRNVVGVAHAPALGETYAAAHGLGARRNGERLAVDPVDSLDDATVVLPGMETFYEAGLGGFVGTLVGRCRRSRGFGDFWGHALVAAGSAHVMVEPELNVWDYAALEPIVTEAGGKISTLDGGSLVDGGSCLTTNGPLHDEVIALAKDLGRDSTG